MALSESAADEAGKIKQERRKEHRDFSLADGMILAIAKQEGAKC